MAEEQINKQVSMIVIGGSSGSLEALLLLFSRLRTGFNIPLLVVLHRNSDFESRLNDLLSARSGLLVHEIEEKEPVAPGYIYLAPADYHVLIEKDKTFSLDYSEKIHFCRPSIDVSFKSAADVYGNGLACVLLSGANMDGADGMRYVKECGGTAIVQDPDRAAFPYMPMQAIKKAGVDFVYGPEQIAAFLNNL